MAGTVDEIIAQLARASAGFSSAAATVLRAQQEVTNAHQTVSTASVGASAHAVTNATAEWETAADKAGKVARLLSGTSTPTPTASPPARLPTNLC